MSNIKQAALEMLLKIEKEISEKQDLRTKSIGDRVIVWDGSANMDKDTKLQRHGIDELFKNEAIVIATGLNINSNEAFYSWGRQIKSYKHNTYNSIMDILLKFPTGEEVYCNSNFVARTDSYSK